MTIPQTLPLSTVERLWEGVFPPVVGATMVILPDRVPDDLPLALPVPDQTTIAGSAMRLNLTTVLCETALSAVVVREFYDRELALLGWEKHQAPIADELAEFERYSEVMGVDDSEGPIGGRISCDSFLAIYVTAPALALDDGGWVYRHPSVDQQIGLSLSLAEPSLTMPQPFSLTFWPAMETSAAVVEQSPMEWADIHDWEDFYQFLPFPRDLLPLPDLKSVPDLQMSTEPKGGSPTQWGTELAIRSYRPRSDILAAYADRLTMAGWQVQTASETNLCAQQTWHYQDADGKLWEFSYFLLEANAIADRLVFWAQPPLPEVPGAICHYVGEVSIHQMAPNSPRLTPPEQRPVVISSRFADLLLGDYQLGELPDAWSEPDLVPPGTTIVISRCHRPINPIEASETHFDSQVVLDVPLLPIETEAFYRRTLIEQGWQPLGGFVPQLLLSGLPQDVDFQMYAKGTQQLTYAVRSLDQPGQSDVRLSLVERSRPVVPTPIQWVDRATEWTETDAMLDFPSESAALSPSILGDYPSPTFPLPLLQMPAGVQCSQTATTLQEGQLLQQANLFAPEGFGELHQQLATQLAAAGCREVTMEQADHISVSRWQVSDRPGIEWQISLMLRFDSQATGRIMLRCEVLRLPEDDRQDVALN
jgi:hypothetical protein